MADKIIKLRGDNSDYDKKIKDSTELLGKLKAQVASLESQLKDVDSSKLDDLKTSVAGVVDASKEPIKLDVSADKATVDALIASMGDVEAQAEIIDGLKPKLEVETNIPEVAQEVSGLQDVGDAEVTVDVKTEGVEEAGQEIDALGEKQPEVDVKVRTNVPEVLPEVDDLDDKLKELSLEQKIELAIDASQAAESISEVRKSQKDIQSLLLQVGDEGSEQYNRLAQAAGASRDKVDDINDAIKAFSKSPIENLSNGFKAVKTSLLDLNFVEFNKQVGLLGQNSKKVSFKELSSSIGETGKSFLSLGKIILANPIGLIATIIGFVVANFDSLKSTIKNIFPPFELLEDLVGGVVQIFKDLGDALGLTSFAFDEASEKALASAEENFDKMKKQGDQAVALARARGQETKAIEEENLKNLIAINESALAEYRKIEQEKGELTDDEIAKQKELMESNEDLRNSMQLLNVEQQKSIDAFIAAGQAASLNPSELRKKQLDDEVAAIDKAAQERIALTNGTEAEINAIFDSANAQKKAASDKFRKSEFDANKSDFDKRKKLLEEEANFQALLKAKSTLPTDELQGLQLLQAGNKELQKIEEARLQRKQDAGKITLDEVLKEKAAIQDRYNEENKALAKAISLKEELGNIEIGIKIVNEVFDAELSDIKTKIDVASQESIEIEARIKTEGPTDELVAKQKEINDRLLELKDEFNAMTLEKSAANLQAQTDQILLERKKQEEILKTGLDSEGNVVSEEERASAAERIAAIDRIIERNKASAATATEVAGIIRKANETAISGVDQATLAEVRRLNALKETGAELTDLEKDFLDLNKNAEIDIKIKTETDALNTAKKELDSLQKKFDDTEFKPISDEDLEILKEQLERAKTSFLEADENLRETQEEVNESKGSPLANWLGVTDEELETIKNTLVQETLDTFRLLGDLIIQREQETLDRRKKQQLEAIDAQQEEELAKLDERVKKGTITAEDAEKKKKEIEKKAAADKLTLDKKAFEDKKKLDLKKLKINFLLEMGAIWLAASQLGYPVGLIIGLIQSAAATVRFGIAYSDIQKQKFEKGGVVGQKSTQNQSQSAQSTQPVQSTTFHGQVKGKRHTDGGETFKVKGTDKMAELEEGEIVIRRSLAVRDRQKLLEYNSGKRQLFEDGGVIGDLAVAAESFVAASGQNIEIPTQRNKFNSPIGFLGEQETPKIEVSVVALDRVQGQLAKNQRNVTFRS